MNSHFVPLSEISEEEKIEKKMLSVTVTTCHISLSSKNFLENQTRIAGQLDHTYAHSDWDI